MRLVTNIHEKRNATCLLNGYSNTRFAINLQDKSILEIIQDPEGKLHLQLGSYSKL